MNVINGLHDGDLTVQEPTTANGSVSGNVTVLDKATLILRGVVDGDVQVQRGAALHVHGRIRGTLTNMGAAVEIWGVVEALRDQEPQMPTIIHPRAVVTRKL